MFLGKPTDPRKFILDEKYELENFKMDAISVEVEGSGKIAPANLRSNGVEGGDVFLAVVPPVLNVSIRERGKGKTEGDGKAKEEETGYQSDGEAEWYKQGGAGGKSKKKARRRQGVGAPRERTHRTRKRRPRGHPWGV